MWILLAFVETALAIFIYTYLYLQAMKWYQNYEFGRHWRRVLGQSVLLVLTLGFLSAVAFFLCLESACTMTSSKFRLGITDDLSLCG